MIAGIFQYEFLQNAFLTGIMIGVIAPLLGVFIVVRRLSLIADALSHVTLAGIAASLLLKNPFPLFSGLNPLYLGMAFSVGGSLFIEKLRGVYKHYQELAIPIILSGGIGLGVIFISLANGFNTDLFSYLFGSVSAVSRTDLWIILIISYHCRFIIIFYIKNYFYYHLTKNMQKLRDSSETVHFCLLLLQRSSLLHNAELLEFSLYHL